MYRNGKNEGQRSVVLGLIAEKGLLVRVQFESAELEIPPRLRDEAAENL